jgi:chromosome segregation ATPase
MNRLILNPSTILGFAATVITCTGMGLKNPSVAFTGLNLGMSAGIVNTSNKKSKDEQIQQLNFQINSLTNKIKDVENQAQEQHQIFSQYQQTLQELKSQQRQALEQLNNNTKQLNSLDLCKLNFKLNNRERQLDQHNKKLKQYQH